MDRFDFGEEKNKDWRVKNAPDLTQARERLKAVSPPPISRDINRPEWADALAEAGWTMKYRLHIRIWSKDKDSPWLSESIAYEQLQKGNE